VHRILCTSDLSAAERAGDDGREPLGPLDNRAQPVHQTFQDALLGVVIAIADSNPPHPFPNFVYVLSGTLTLRDKASGKTRVVHRGQAVGESVDDIHRGESGDEPTVLLITCAGTSGVPISVPAKGEKAEY